MSRWALHQKLRKALGCESFDEGQGSKRNNMNHDIVYTKKKFSCNTLTKRKKVRSKSRFLPGCSVLGKRLSHSDRRNEKFSMAEKKYCDIPKSAF